MCHRDYECQNDVYASCDGCNAQCYGLYSCHGSSLTCVDNTCNIECKNDFSCYEMSLNISSVSSMNVYCNDTALAPCYYENYYVVIYYSIPTNFLS